MSERVEKARKMSAARHWRPFFGMPPLPAMSISAMGNQFINSLNFFNMGIACTLHTYTFMPICISKFAVVII